MFCSNCGQEASGNFCSNCGAPLSKNSAPTQAVNFESAGEVIIWEGKPAGLKDKAKDQMNVNSTVYRLTNQRVIVGGGLLSKKQEEIELNKIKDFSVKQTLIEKTMGIGNVEIISIDPTSPKLTLGNVPDPFVVKDKIRAAMLEYKRQLNIQYREQL
ncbi:MAG: PH domain-containing protein [Eubacteriales bacterium]|nr:PH domain-containing protein [Eubacteriales bacterium]